MSASVYFGEAFQYQKKGQDAADSLTEEGGPRHAGNAHGEGFYEENVHEDVGA